MIRALVTVNYGSILTPNSRASMQAAASRWGIDFFEMNETTIPKIDGLHPAAMKTAAFKVLSYDEIFYLDADCIVSCKCPNPFDIFWDKVALRVVHDSSPLDCRIQDWALHARKMPDLLNIPLSINNYWNSGMILARRCYHEQMFELANRICQTDFGSPWVDQTVLNMAAILEDVEIEFVSERWNYLHVQRFQDFMNFGKHADAPYIFHGAGDPSRVEWLHTVNWQ